MAQSLQREEWSTNGNRPFNGRLGFRLVTASAGPRAVDLTQGQPPRRVTRRDKSPGDSTASGR